MSRSENLLLSRHALVLVFVALNPEIEVPRIASAVGADSRSVYRILNDLDSAGYLARRRDGWRNVYEVRRDAAVQGPDFIDSSVGELLSAVLR
jgi:DNA-binding IclR family transcriptional regulator